ncbi:helix-turn-helix domain-containing protein [Novosphingobium cyanobacteriorum]|uniref:Short-chain fatty acyl-CoA regulator family protein n=1 Tax=Novosphingobium cyanobacteriorum TaxID=3024215 RepID=A0ABT6CGK2_9SPHN|nr:XRE family transcriptional regulator [Novosphingobium cyanobacteriorum]MDF8332644.1 short-chain fatty acyl-CoA regulator family protein [Novosphingobium cyanobacteriorum]
MAREPVSRPLYLGPRLKRLRRELGLTQQAMAEELAISPSYIALLERNQRPLTADLLLRLARTYRLDMADLAAEERDDYARRLSEVLRDPIFAEIDLPALEVADVATSYPGITEAMLRLHTAYMREQQALAGLRAGAGTDAASDPVGEARRFVAARRNYFPTLDSKAEALSEEIDKAGGSAEWLRRQGVRLRLLPADVMMGALRRYDRHAEQLLLEETLPLQARTWQIALHIAYTALRPDIAALVRGESFASETAAQLVRRALAAYAAAALIMPYDRFARAVEAHAYDMDALAGRFGASFEQVAHRLTTLNRPGQERVPFFFIRVDAAGNVSKRLDGAGFPFAAHGGGCPLWTLHDVFRRPGEVLTQWLELPDGQRFFSIARSVTSGGGSWGRPAAVRAIALACAAEHAPRLVYAQGPQPEPTPIGVTCRLCNRAACTARAEPPLGREILPDDYRRTAEPFTFAES